MGVGEGGEGYARQYEIKVRFGWGGGGGEGNAGQYETKEGPSQKRKKAARFN